MADAPPWYLYLLLCRNGAWYAGITPDLEARMRAHADGTGARYTRANPPVRLLASRAYPDRSAASRAEWQVQRLPKARTLAFLQEGATSVAERPPGRDADGPAQAPASSAGSSQPS